MSKSEKKPLFEEAGGLYTIADLSMVAGTSPVSVDVDGDEVRLSLSVSGGKVTTHLTGERAAELGEALLDGSTQVEDRR